MYTYFFQSQNTKEYDLDISVYMLFMWPYFEDPIWSTFLTCRAISFKQSIGGHKWHYRRDIDLNTWDYCLLREHREPGWSVKMT